MPRGGRFWWGVGSFLSFFDMKIGTCLPNLAPKIGVSGRFSVGVSWPSVGLRRWAYNRPSNVGGVSWFWLQKNGAKVGPPSVFRGGRAGPMCLILWALLKFAVACCVRSDARGRPGFGGLGSVGCSYVLKTASKEDKRTSRSISMIVLWSLCQFGACFGGL